MYKHPDPSADWDAFCDDHPTQEQTTVDDYPDLTPTKQGATAMTGKGFRRLRKAAGYTVGGLAEALQIGTRTIERTEVAATVPAERERALRNLAECSLAKCNEPKEQGANYCPECRKVLNKV